MPPPLTDDQIGFSSVSFPATGFVQLPDIPCKEMWIGGAPNFYLAGSITPGTNYIPLAPSGTQVMMFMIPTGGNTKNLFIGSSNNTAGTLNFMWRNPRTQLVGMAA